MSRQFDALKLHARLALRDLVWLLTNRHRQGEKPNIAAFGSRRSGSTLLMQTIAANPGVKSIDQPDSIFSASAYQARLLPIRDCGQLHHLDDQEQRIFQDYVDAIVAGELHINEPWRFWRRNFAWRSDRLVFKITNAHGAAQWMTTTFGWQTVALLRHPLSQSLSVRRLEGGPGGWQPRAPGLFRSEAYCRDHLDDDLVARAHDIWRSGDALDRHVLGWILENLPLLQAWRGEPTWSLVSYEAMVLEPEQVVAGLAHTLDLPDRAHMRATLGEASVSVRNLSSTERKEAIRRGDRQAMLSSWRRHVDQDALRRYGAWFEAFGVDLYRPDRDVPEPLLSFPEGRDPARAAA